MYKVPVNYCHLSVGVFSKNCEKSFCSCLKIDNRQKLHHRNNILVVFSNTLWHYALNFWKHIRRLNLTILPNFRKSTTFVGTNPGFDRVSRQSVVLNIKIGMRHERSERNLSHTILSHTHHVDWSGIEKGSPRWEVRAWPPNLWHGSFKAEL